MKTAPAHRNPLRLAMALLLAAAALSASRGRGAEAAPFTPFTPSSAATETETPEAEAPEPQAPEPEAAAAETPEPVLLQYERAPVGDLIEQYSRLTGRPTIITGYVEGEVSLKSPRPLPPAQAATLLKRAIESTGVTLIEDEEPDGPVRVVPAGGGERVVITYEAKYREAELLARSLNDVAGEIFRDGTPPRAATCQKKLLIAAPETTRDKLMALLKTMDTRTRQVHIEAKFIEVTSDVESRIGVEWQYQFKNHAYTETDQLGNKTKHYEYGQWGQDLGTKRLSQITENAFATGNIPVVEGLKYAFLTPTLWDDVKGILELYNQESKVRVLSTPSLIAAEGTEAELRSGRRVPYLSAVSYNGTPTPTKEYTQYDVGIEMRIRPVITDDGDVLLDIYHEFTDVLAVNDANQQTFGQRKARTRVVVKNGHTLVLSGLMRDTEKTTVTGIPVLKNLPVVGAFFRREVTTPEKTELLLLLTPTVVTDDRTGDRLTDLEREKYPDATEHAGEDFEL
jgi:type II secretory pathway component GspD/PulD (secretin)